MSFVCKEQGGFPSLRNAKFIMQPVRGSRSAGFELFLS